MKTFPRQVSFAVFLFVIALILTACGGSPTPTPTATMFPATNTPVPSATPIPPTETATSTATSAPTDTTIPTETPEPTVTPLPPTPTLTNPDLLLELDTGLESLAGLDFSADGRYLAAFDQNQTVSIWDLATGDHIRDLQVFGALRILFSPDGELLATLSSDVAQLWQIRDGALLGEYTCTGEFEMDMQFVPSGELAILGILEEERLNLTYLPSGEQRKFAPHSENALVKQGVLSPAGDLLALGCSDGQIELYTAANGNLVRTIGAHIDWVMNLDFSADGQFLASDSFSFDPYIKVWQVSDGTLIGTPEDTKWDAGYLEFSPDGSLLVSYSSYGSRIWRSDDWSLFAEIAYLPQFSPDGAYLGDWDESGLHVWDVSNGNLVQNFTPDNLRNYGFPPTLESPQIALAMTSGKIEIRQISPADEPLGTLATPTPPSSDDLYTLIETSYGEAFNGEYVEWDDSMQTYLVHGFAAGEVDFDLISIQTRSGVKLGTALATIRLLNLHDGKHNSILVPLAIETEEGILFLPGLGDPIPEPERNDFMTYLREEKFLGRAVTVIVAFDIESAKEAIGMPVMPWQDDLLAAYQESWQPELEAIIETGQAVSIDGQDLLLMPLDLWFNSFDPLPVP